MKIPYNVLGNTFFIRPYNTKQEKEVLLLKDLQKENPNYCLDGQLDIFGYSLDNDIPLSSLTNKEKILLLYLYRGVSVGDECQITFQCNKCNKTSQNRFLLDFIKQVPSELSYFRILDKELTSKNLHEFISVNYFLDNQDKEISSLVSTEGAGNLNCQNIEELLDELDVDVHDDLFNQVKELNENFSFIRKLTCSNCLEVASLDCSDINFVLENMSEQTILIIYDSITRLVTLGYSKQDIDNLIPFERSILIDLMTDLIQKEQEQTGKQGLF